MAPVDRIKRALGAEKAAAFDRLLSDLADRVEQVVAAELGANPAINLRFHKGRLVEGALQRDEKYT